MVIKCVKKFFVKIMKGSDKSIKIFCVGIIIKVFLFSDWFKKKYGIEYDFEYIILLKINNFIFFKILSI